MRNNITSQLDVLINEGDDLKNSTDLDFEKIRLWHDLCHRTISKIDKKYAEEYFPMPFQRPKPGTLPQEIPHPLLDDEGFTAYDRKNKYIREIDNRILYLNNLKNNLERFHAKNDKAEFSVLAGLPSESRNDLIKAEQRLRDGDLSGAISSVCGALDAATSKIYLSESLGDPSGASFQQRCKRSLDARGVIPRMKQQLRELGWSEKVITPFLKNFEGAMNQGAYVMQALRTNMGDVHGTKPILKSLVFACLKWAELMLRTLNAD